jgi:hypothetical protein
MRPGERFQVQTDYLGNDSAFSVSFWVDTDDKAAGIEHLTVWVEKGDCYAEVTDTAGNVVECGHQRPEEVSGKSNRSGSEKRWHPGRT